METIGCPILVGAAHDKIDVPNLVTCSHWTRVFEWWCMWLGAHDVTLFNSLAT